MTTPPTPEAVAELARALEGATALPWEHCSDIVHGTMTSEIWGRSGTKHILDNVDDADARLIVAAVNAAPGLLAAASELHEAKAKSLLKALINIEDEARLETERDNARAEAVLLDDLVRQIADEREEARAERDQLRRDLDKAQADADNFRRVAFEAMKERDQLRSELLQVSEALGMVVAADGHAPEAASVGEMVGAVERLRSECERLREQGGRVDGVTRA